MEFIVYVFGACFIFMALALMVAYQRTKHYGLFLMGITYAASAGLAIVLMHWWPLVAGFVLVWMLKLLGLEPDAEPPRESKTEIEPPRRRENQLQELNRGEKESSKTND